MPASFRPAHLAQSFLPCLADEAVELLELAEDLLGKVDIALVQHGEAPADALIGAAQPYQLRLLKAHTRAQAVALGDEALDRRGAGERGVLHGLTGCKFGSRRFGIRRRGVHGVVVHFGLLSSSREETVGASRSTNPTGGPTKLAAHLGSFPQFPSCPTDRGIF